MNKPPQEIEEILRFAIEGRKRVKDQILRIDDTMALVKFGYASNDGEWTPVTTLEEDEYPDYYHRGRTDSAPKAQPTSLVDVDGPQEPPTTPQTVVEPQAAIVALPAGQRDFAEGQKGVSYESLLMPYLQGASEFELHDPYIRQAHQGRNLVDLLALIAAEKDPADEVTFKLYTLLDEDPEYQRRQLQMLNEILQGAVQQGIKLTIAKDPGGHDRWIRANNGWRINLGRGLDIFQRSEGGWFDFGTSRQEFRQLKAFGVTYIREE